ncbi:MAG: hypothetical protein Q8N00_00345 [Nitrospirota bacterium]|nr:hypothetical protein [Nitrospirota bacterium]MDP3597950.1 hypothetical protein [Nitrospirota bacterium]
MGPIGNLLEETKITKLNDATAAGTSAINSGIVDMSGYDGVVFLTSTGTVLATGTATIKAQQGAVSNMADAADLIGTSQAFIDTDDNRSVAIDIKRPNERYVRCVITRAVANSDWGPIWALQYRARKVPVAQGLDKYESHTNPIEGTA